MALFKEPPHSLICTFIVNEVGAFQIPSSQSMWPQYCPHSPLGSLSHFPNKHCDFSLSFLLVIKQGIDEGFSTYKDTSSQKSLIFGSLLVQSGSHVSLSLSERDS